MEDNKIKNNEEALKAIQIGVNILADTVGKTLGPKGRNVVIRKKHFTTVTKDGVTVAMQIFLPDPYENAGAQMVKEVALKTNQIAGDGTTTATILAQAIVNAGLKNIAAGANPMDLKRGIEKAVKQVVLHLKENSNLVGDDYEKIRQIGTISANGDTEIGELIASTMEKIGQDGVIYIEESRLPFNKVEIIEGIQVNQGYISPYFVTDSARGICELNNPRILLYDGRLSSIGPLIPLLDVLVKSQTPLLIIADDVDGETLSSMVYNKNKGIMQVCCIKSPFGDNSKEVMKDIAAATGGDYLTEDEGMKLEYAVVENLGTCDKVIIGENITTIINGGGDPEKVADHIGDLKSLREDAGSEYDRDRLTDRIAKLSKGIAVLYVGGQTESEMKEKKDRVEDALNATRAAMEEGYIPGGGVGYIRAINAVDEFKIFEIYGELNDDEKLGIKIIKSVLYEPLRHICLNGALNADLISANVKQGKGNFGFNARKEDYGDMVEEGVIDPTKVARVALENAASVATLILTTSAIIID